MQTEREQIIFLQNQQMCKAITAVTVELSWPEYIRNIPTSDFYLMFEIQLLIQMPVAVNPLQYSE